MRKNNILFLLLALMLISGCGGNTTDASLASDNEKEMDTIDTISTETETEIELHDDLPEELDFLGAEIGICSSKGAVYNGNLDITEYDENSSALDQSIYNRNRDVEERLHIQLTEFLASAADEAKKTFINTVSAGDAAYPILHQADRTVFNLGLQGYMLDLNQDMPYIDLTKSYWQQDGNAVLENDGKAICSIHRAFSASL